MGSMNAGRWWDLGHQVQTWGTAHLGPRGQSPWRGGEICSPLCPTPGRASMTVPTMATYSRPCDIKIVWGQLSGAAADRVSQLPRRWQSCIRTTCAGSPQMAPDIYWHSSGCTAQEAQLWMHSPSQRLLETSSNSMRSSSHHPPTLLVRMLQCYIQ